MKNIARWTPRVNQVVGIDAVCVCRHRFLWYPRVYARVGVYTYTSPTYKHRQGMSVRRRPESKRENDSICSHDRARPARSTTATNATTTTTTTTNTITAVTLFTKSIHTRNVPASRSHTLEIQRGRCDSVRRFVSCQTSSNSQCSSCRTLPLLFLFLITGYNSRK